MFPSPQPLPPSRGGHNPPPSGGWTPAPAIRASIWLHAAALAGTAAYPASWSWAAGVVAGNHAVLGLIGMWPRSPAFGPVLVRLPEPAGPAGEVAITFDDGPDPDVTPAVLDMLDRYGARASFFCVGRRAAAHPDLVREITRRGHGVENHTDTHPLGFACLGPASLRREIARAQERLAELAGRAPRFFRAPLGLRTPLMEPVVARQGLRSAAWTRRGYDGRCGDADRVLGRLVRGLAARDVLLLHDGGSARTRAGHPVVLEVLPALLDRISALGLRSVALPAPTDGAAAAQAGE